MAVVGVLVAAGTTAIAAGPAAGLALGVGVLVVLAVLPAPYAFAAGHAAFLVVPPEPRILLGVEAGLLLVLVSAALASRTPRTVLAGVAVSLVGLWALLWAATVVQPSTWTAAAVLLVTVALLVYGIDRYERVRLGLLDR